MSGDSKQFQGQHIWIEKEEKSKYNKSNYIKVQNEAQRTGRAAACMSSVMRRHCLSSAGSNKNISMENARGSQH